MMAGGAPTSSFLNEGDGMTKSRFTPSVLCCPFVSSC